MCPRLNTIVTLVCLKNKVCLKSCVKVYCSGRSLRSTLEISRVKRTFACVPTHYLMISLVNTSAVSQQKKMYHLVRGN